MGWGNIRYTEWGDMAEGQEAQAQNPPTTIWTQLDVWAQGFKPWQHFVLAHAVRFGRCESRRQSGPRNRSDCLTVAE
jgi:hypothetical protein